MDDGDNIKKTISKVAMYVLGCAIPMAVFGNILTILVFQRGHRCRNSKFSIYFKALAIADIYVLLFPCMELFLVNLPEPLPIRTYHISFCKFASFNVIFAVEVSVWITVALTIERTLNVCFPMTFSQTMDANRMYPKLVLIILFVAALNSYTLFYYTLYEIDNTVYCVTFDPLSYLMDKINTGVFIFALPLVTYVTCNIVLLRKLYRRVSLRDGSTLTSSQIASRANMNLSITYRVMAISVVHLLSTAPFPVLHLYLDLVYSDPDRRNKQPPSFTYAHAVFNILFYMNSLVNFYLYCATGLDFRRDLCEMCSFCRTKTNQLRSSLLG